MSLCHARGRFLYEVQPDVFPEGFLTRTELELWARFYEQQSEQQKKWQI